MRALLTPEIARGMGIVLLRPGADLMPIFTSGRVLVELPPASMAHLATGPLPPARQPLAEDTALAGFFRHEDVIRVAGGTPSLERWLMKHDGGCQYSVGDWHHEELTTFRHEPGAIRVCWHCDNVLRGQHTQRLAEIAQSNVVAWVIAMVRGALGFDDSHELTLPELCWWALREEVTHALPDSITRRALRLPAEPIHSVTRESDIVPSAPATEILRAKAGRAGAAAKCSSNETPQAEQNEQPQLLVLKVDPESPESYMLRPKRRRWENPKYTRWVKQQPCACCNLQADDPHHLIGHGQGGMGTKAHDLFVLPLCRRHHDELHRDPVAFEEKYGSQLELIFRFLDRALAIGVLS
ncbi:DUF968 domain-containing protein [Cronobacter sakazakii]|nr:DUF968 domain-containing protein [Cronobacter sakazakii]EKY1907504.1 DUF968 domain-containing protein [Cronobacter sakazakii]EKY1910686.1 DUF968 domain-containing protein [Cronobacter sakazakii]EKY1914990.1 DUF968 domain-containing protein [Cronobacter sakazakii]EKY1918398.1 DUF968 domain-containing protein [Cronobacter sakazakii]